MTPLDFAVEHNLSARAAVMISLIISGDYDALATMLPTPRESASSPRSNFDYAERKPNINGTSYQVDQT
jgi:hypothetical protein